MQYGKGDGKCQEVEPTIVVNMVFKHLILQDAAELRQGFQVDDVDNERSEDII